MPLILVTNDDGITAGGLKTLVNSARKFGDVLVVAPDSPQSAQGHAITIERPVFVRESDVFGEEVEAYECSGTPVDCVKIAKSVLLNGRMPDLCVSGINHGSNAAINIIYSGTLSAAMEASLEGTPSIGFSFLDYKADADFSVCVPYVEKLISHVLTNGMAEGNLYNVNIPNLPADQIRGIKVCRQAEARWVEEYVRGEDPRGRPYYWLTGKFVNNEASEDADANALQAGYVSLVPSHHDLTNHLALEQLKAIETELQPAKVGNSTDQDREKQQLEQF
ncbi:5'/3'-nucleotidase SurE [Neolewinella aurantiaca]|uniref:5'-nucleotidase SurE n=1 Tax=Neolewinella aurantiaca TaxID=2602767 RepID=A0A5C7FKA1_9BACT|nr:5'/3'-nucleotidase SurE [Neolewinella aurantiaca]TXF86714.1 5'/3'-nucleotidase SurE [Neolewinella aurantiaca]